MTLRRPSSTSRSLRLSRSFLIWFLSSGRDECREFRAAEAASRVSSWAVRGAVSLACAVIGVPVCVDLPFSRSVDMRDSGSIFEHHDASL